MLYECCQYAWCCTVSLWLVSLFVVRFIWSWFLVVIDMFFRFFVLFGLCLECGVV